MTIILELISYPAVPLWRFRSPSVTRAPFTCPALMFYIVLVAQDPLTNIIIITETSLRIRDTAIGRLVRSCSILKNFQNLHIKRPHGRQTTVDHCRCHRDLIIIYTTWLQVVPCSRQNVTRVIAITLPNLFLCFNKQKIRT